jgi:hypothetical protein
MTRYNALVYYATQLTDDIERAVIIVSETLWDATGMDTLTTARQVNQFLLVTIRNKCYDYNRLGKSPELQAAELNVPVGCLAQELRAIREGRYF